jgi:uncharacterized protein YecE (DUF72 family)
MLCMHAWQGPFYPSDIDDSNWLGYYASVFNYVEIDSSFYRTPNVFTVKNWFNKTPDSFKFARSCIYIKLKIISYY